MTTITREEIEAGRVGRRLMSTHMRIEDHAVLEVLAQALDMARVDVLHWALRALQQDLGEIRERDEP